MPMITEGRYNAIAEAWKLGITDNGKKYIAVQFKFLEGPVGERRTWHGYFTEKTQRRTIEAMRYCGWVGHDLLNLEGLDRNMIQLVVQHEEYEGKVRDRIAWVNSPSTIMVKTPLEGSALERFAQQMKGMAMSVEEVEGTPPPTDTIGDGNGSNYNTDPFPEQGDNSYSPPHADDDYPF